MIAKNCEHRILWPKTFAMWKPVYVRCPDCDKVLLQDEINALIKRRWEAAVATIKKDES